MVSENMCPTYLNNLFTNNLCNRTLRSAHNKQLPTFNTVKYGKRSIKYHGPQLWNCLPDEMKTSSTLSAFKQNVKLWCGIECRHVDYVYHVKLCINNNIQQNKSMYLNTYNYIYIIV